MAWDPHELDEAERLLNRGQPSGPRLDQVWERLEPQVTAAARVARPAWWRWAWAPAAVFACALLVVVRPSGFRERGAVLPGATVEATCGSADTPCRVGQPLFARVHVGATGGVATVVVRSSTGRALLADGLVTEPSSTTLLPAKVIPDAQDAAGGLELVLFWSDAPLSEAERAAILEDASPRPPVHVLRLDVLP
jgi:hypothetical protein